jgi:CubicO group peptidase (beta-lactamase class C family)
MTTVRALAATVAVAVGCVLAASAAPAAAAEPGEPDAAAIADVVRAHVGAARLPGVAVAVIYEDRVLHVGGYGHDSRGEPVTERTPMWLGGVSESFTAIVLAQLAGFRSPSLDDPVVAHLPEFTTADPRSAQITVRQLLDHTSGLPATHDAPQGRPRSLQEAVAGLRDVTLVAPPGERRVRSEVGYQVAARLAEVVTQRPFDTVVWDRVLFQTGMHATTAVAGTRDLVPGLVDGHDRFLGLSRPQAEPDRFVGGSGGIVSTAEEIATWLQFNAGWGLRTVMAGEGLREVQRLGWEERPGGGLVLRGRTATASATLVLLPGPTPEDRYGVAVLANSREPLDGGDGTGVSEVDDLADELVALVRGTAPPAPGPPRAFLAGPPRRGRRSPGPGRCCGPGSGLGGGPATGRAGRCCASSRTPCRCCCSRSSPAQQRPSSAAPPSATWPRCGQRLSSRPRWSPPPARWWWPRGSTRWPAPGFSRRREP